MPRHSALAQFLGFDPDADPNCVEVDETGAPIPIAAPPPPPPASPAPIRDATAALDLASPLRDALKNSPKRVLLLALKALFEASRPIPGQAYRPGGAYGACKEATCWALREVGHAYRTEVTGSGWIVGKRDNPHT